VDEVRGGGELKSHKLKVKAIAEKLKPVSDFSLDSFCKTGNFHFEENYSKASQIQGLVFNVMVNSFNHSG